MKKKMHAKKLHFSERFFDAIHKFYYFFHYYANTPGNVDFDQEEYADLLDKCVADNFDYTIELYGTEPIVPEPYDPYALIID